MALNTDSLKAFLTLTQSGSFTKAAAALGLTQSALSQKIAKLEDQLESTLLVRGSEGLTLTSAGEKLLIHARQQLQLEEEFLAGFGSQNGKSELSGHLRIAGFSSIMRSMIIPALSPWLRQNPGVSVEFSSHEVHELSDILKSNQADMIITDYWPNFTGVDQMQIGEEEYVHIQSKKYKKVPEVFLDHYPLDNATESFFTFQGEKRNIKRSYMGDVYGIIDGVEQGIGQAIMSRHLVEGDKRFTILKSKRRYVRPLVLSYFRQSYYPLIHREAREQLITLAR